MVLFVVLGVLARIDGRSREPIESNLCAHAGVSVFSVGDEQRLGILIEGDSLASARACLHDQVESTPGVLAAWPVFVQDESEELGASRSESVRDRMAGEGRQQQ
jgi:hypothetical protein